MTDDGKDAHGASDEPPLVTTDEAEAMLRRRDIALDPILDGALDALEGEGGAPSPARPIPARSPSEG